MLSILRSAAYRPKSLVLKSFMYIDESENDIAHEHTRNQKTATPAVATATSATTTTDITDNEVVASSSRCLEATSNGNHDTGTSNVLKKDLRRSGSLRISTSIKGALNLTKKAGVTSSSHLAKISESLRDKFSVGRSRPKKSSKHPIECIEETQNINSNNNNNNNNNNSYDLETCSETSSKVVRLSPGNDGKYGFKIREKSFKNYNHRLATKPKKERSIIIYDVSPDSPAATCDPRLYEGDLLLTINGKSTAGLSETQVEDLIKTIRHQKPPDLVLEVNSRHNVECLSVGSSGSRSDLMSRLSPISNSSSLKKSNHLVTLADSIKELKKSIDTKELLEEFEKLSRKKEDESLDESKLMENIEKNRYRDILPYDSTRVQLIDSMTGDYINASFVDMAVPSGNVNRYIATQGPLASTCDDFWQMVWEQNCSLIIMVTPLVEAGRVKCHKYWPDEKEEIRYGQILVRNVCEKSKTATIERTIQLIDVKSGEKRSTNQIQYKAWPDHEVPEDCSDFLKLINRVRKHRLSKPTDPIVVHCSAGIGRTGVLILMETAICMMEADEPLYPIKILEDMRRQRAMLIQTNSQFQFVADAICKVYDQKLKKKSKKSRKR